jgi:dTDP-4-dehydrorhamnose reductase
MVHFSTDYVLDGATPGLHDEEAKVAPLSAYAATKRRGEEAVLAAGGCVMRVSWVFGAEKPAFPEAIASKALAGEPLAAVGDKTSLPCFTRDLSDWVLAVVEKGIPNEILHACQSGDPTSWRGMAVEVLAWLVETGRLSEMPEVRCQALDEVAFFRAVRPRHTAMATGRLAARIGQVPRDWREALREHLSESSGVCR